MTQATLELTDVGPVEHLSIPIPEEGGIVVLRGANGTGKSTILRAADRLATGRKDITITARDGAPRGEICGAGVTLRVARSITRTGELEFEHLDGRLSVAELVDPGLKGAEESDARRIKALVQLAGVQPDVKLFAGLFDSVTDFDAVTKGKNLETDDILILADRIKRAIDEAARNAEGIANTEKAKAAASREAAAGIDTTAETDEGILQRAVEDAIRTEQRLASELSAAKARNAEVRTARQAIEAALANTGIVPIADAKRTEAEAADRVVTLRENVESARQRLIESERELRTAEQEWKRYAERLAASETFFDSVADLEAVIAKGELPEPSADELEDAAEAVMIARENIGKGALARRAADHKAKAAEHAAREVEALKRAETLREAAKRVDDVLSEQIGKLGVPLEVRAGRLWTKHSRRGSTPYAELSAGERWRMALDIAIEAVGPRGLLSIPQEAFEGLDPQNRELIKEHVKGRGVVILTAEATDGPIRAEIE